MATGSPNPAVNQYFTVTLPGSNSVTPTVIGGGGAAGGVYTSGGMGLYTSPPFAPPIHEDTFNVLQRGGRHNRITQAQYERLMDHEFIPMEDGHPYCLLCFALDTYRLRADHEYVIHED